MSSISKFPPSFTIDKKNVLKLFVGDAFYSNVDASLREAVLNSIDSISRRQRLNQGLTAQIEVVFDRQSLTITITDNGEGMAENEVAELFSKIGASASELLADNGDSIGKFGIGVLSYFLISDYFELHTKKEDSDPLGLKFTKTMLEDDSPAEVISPKHSQVGTKLILSINQEEKFNYTLSRFPFWIRDVEGLVGIENPGNNELNQGELARPIKIIEHDMPEWIHKARIGPPEDFNVWDTFDGSGKVEVLYKGVFVEQVSIEGLWAINGVIHVDPLQFKPKLNREGFIGDNLTNALEPVLRDCHPKVLIKAADCIREFATRKETKEWSIRKWVTLWLAIPRAGQYEQAAEIWDREFQEKPAFRQLLANSQQNNLSLNQIIQICNDKKYDGQIYLVPPELTKLDPVIQQAVRVLRSSKNIVVQGISRHPSYLQPVRLIGNSSGDLLSKYLLSKIPSLFQIDKKLAREVVSAESLVSIYLGPPEVKIVQLGEGALAVLAVDQEIWINQDSDNGKKIISRVCEQNSGHIGLWVAILEYTEHVTGDDSVIRIARLLSKQNLPRQVLGPIKRQYINSFTQ